MLLAPEHVLPPKVQTQSQQGIGLDFSITLATISIAPLIGFCAPY